MDQQNEILLRFNSVIIIQSLPESESQSGSELFSSIISRLCEKHGYKTSLCEIDSKKEFFKMLTSILEFVEKGMMPIIHFEMHGFKDGLALKNNEKILWSEFSDFCRQINIVTKNNLFITLSSCFGARIINMIEILKPAPFWGIVGPKEEIENGWLEEDFSDFYDAILQKHDLKTALDCLVFNSRREKYIYLHCMGIFEHLIEKKFRGTQINKTEKFKRLFKESKLVHPTMNRVERRKVLKSNIRNFDRDKFIDQIKSVFLIN